VRITRNTTLRSAVALVAAALALLAVSSCGGSSKGGSSSSTSAAAASATTPGAPAGHFAALRECLHRNGITLPPRKPGSVRGLLGGRGLPPGVTAAQFEAALKKCGVGPLAGRRLRFPALRGLSIKSPKLRAALTRFAACMREHGVTLPAPNTTGKGPVFNTARVNLRSPQFLRAQAACRRVLTG
jgi:hypothetical protein